MSIPPFSDQRPTCKKCALQSITMNKYDYFHNTIDRKCVGCGYEWTERPADYKEPV